MRISVALRAVLAMISLAAGLVLGAAISLAARAAAEHANRRGRLLERRFAKAGLREEESSHWRGKAENCLATQQTIQPSEAAVKGIIKKFLRFVKSPL